MVDKFITLEGVKYRLTPVDGQMPLTGIASLKAGDKKIDLTATVSKDWKLNVFTRQDGSEGRVHSLLVKDDTGSIKVAVWGDLTETVANIQENDIITVHNGYVKKGQEKKDEQGNTVGNFLELHVGQYSTIAVLPQEEQSQL